ncbi:MAG TPA: serine hydrolase domain-containing protein [Pirellulales bacterium]|jgi:CubicO group peptidase (beta-lactamase class C family)
MIPTPRRFLLLAPLLALALVSAAAADEFDALREKIPRELTARGVPSLAVCVARDGQIIWEQGFGWADREKRIEANEHTMYSLASISKPIAATGLAILCQQGKIDLDKPINDYLGEAKVVARVGAAADATVRRVANHTSGLPLHYQFFYEDEVYRRPPMDETIRRYANLVTAPGERFQYSNLGYGLLDYVIARQSGRTFVDTMREEVFLPLGLTRMSVDIGPGLEKFTATRYGTDGLPIPFYDFDHPGGSAVFASAHDLARFGMFHAGSKLANQREILNDEWRKRMQEPTADIEGGRRYGVGWFIQDDKLGRRVVSHSGGMGGVSTLLSIVPEQKVVVVALSNGASPLPAQVSAEIMDIVLAKPSTEKKDEPVAEKPKSDKDEAAEAIVFGKPPEGRGLKPLTGRWKGIVHTYEKDLPIELWVQEDGDVHVKLDDQLETLLTGARFRDGWLRGRLRANLGTEDVNRTKHELHLEVKLRDDVLNGSLIATSYREPRVGNALTHWIEVKKQPE